MLTTPIRIIIQVNISNLTFLPLLFLGRCSIINWQSNLRRSLKSFNSLPLCLPKAYSKSHKMKKSYESILFTFLFSYAGWLRYRFTLPSPHKISMHTYDRVRPKLYITLILQTANLHLLRILKVTLKRGKEARAKPE